MARNSSTSSSDRVPIAFLLAALLCVGAHCFVAFSDGFWVVAYRYSKIPKEDPLRLEAILRAIPGRESPQRKVLLVGSSLTREGFDVKLLNERFRADKLSFYNLGVAGSSQPLDLYMLRKRLFEKAPEMIMYMPFVESFYSSYDDNDYNRLHHHFDYSVLPHLLRHFGWGYVRDHQRTLGDALLGKISILYRFRKQFNRVAVRWLTAKLTGAPDPEPMSYEYTENQPPEYFAAKVNEYGGEYRYARSEYTELNEMLFREFVRETHEAGIQLVVIDGPVHPRMQAFFSEDTAREYQTFLERSERELGFVYLRRDELPRFSSEDFIDFAHLNAVGREKLSGFMAGYVVNAGSRHGWKVSPGRDSTAGVAGNAAGGGRARESVF